MDAKPTDPGFRIEPLGDHHDRTIFSCGIPALERYFKQFAGQDSRKRVARVYVATVDGRRVLGFYTLSAYSIELKTIPSSSARHLPRYDKIPATLLGRLAVDSVVAGKGLGRTLLVHALKTAWEASRTIASAGVVADAKDESAKEFYLHFDFLPLVGASESLFLPMRSIERLMQTE